jgi:hypothetical protein
MCGTVDTLARSVPFQHGCLPRIKFVVVSDEIYDVDEKLRMPFPADVFRNTYAGHLADIMDDIRARVEMGDIDLQQEIADMEERKATLAGRSLNAHPHCIGAKASARAVERQPVVH